MIRVQREKSPVPSGKYHEHISCSSLDDTDSVSVSNVAQFVLFDPVMSNLPPNFL